MPRIPEVSVVMGVYNGGASLPRTLDSILAQEDVDLEFVVVNDGSRDDSGRILDDYARRDSRLRVFHQENRGLTKTLIRGCSEARAPTVARQDAGDRSLPGRLRQQLQLLAETRDAVLVSCGTRFLTPTGEHLFEVQHTDSQADAGIRAAAATALHGPSHHGATLFRRDAYLAAGGYRQQFRMAQDLDLWIRMAEHGRHVVVPRILYEAEFAINGISSGRCAAQRHLLEVILESSHLRRAGADETSVLKRAESFSEAARSAKGRPGEAAYFIGACLARRDPAAARRYFEQSFKENRLNPRVWLRLLRPSKALSR